MLLFIGSCISYFNVVFQNFPCCCFQTVYDEFKITKCSTKSIPLWLSGEGGGGGGLERGGKIFKTSGNGGSFLKCSKILGA